MANGPEGAADGAREASLAPASARADMLALLTSVLEHADQGIAVYDTDYVLACCNARYPALLGLPQGALAAGDTKLIDILHLMAARGDYGEEDRHALAMARFATMRSGAEPRYERRMPGGKWIQFNSTVLPGGGLLVTLTDVTAIKEAEQASNTARDEATRMRRQLAAAIESMSEGFILWDSQDRLVMFNTRYRDEYSFAPDLLVPGISFEAILRAGVERGAVPVGYDPEEWVQDRLRQHRNPPPPYVVERLDRRSVLITEYRTHDGGIVGIRTDVTLIKDSERAAREARQRLVDAIEAIPQGFAIFDPDDRLILFNQAYRERYSLVPDMVRPGIRYEELPREIARRGLVNIPPGQHEAWIAERVAQHREGKRKLLDQRKGRWIAIEESRTASGHIVVIHTEVTELKNREQEARRSRRMLRNVIDAVPAIISVKDRNSRYVLMNRFQGDVYGIDPAAAIGRTSAEVVGAEYGGHSQELDERVITSGAPLPWAERAFVDARGQTYTWLTTKVPLKDDEQRVENVLTVALDISALKATERARANLARYVAPTMVDLLAGADEPFGPARSQNIGIVFADMVGFTQFAADASADLVFALLRDFQRRLARIVFAWGGTLDKFTGDGIMATFGTPSPTDRDAANALQCARAIALETASLDRERRARGEPSLRASVGVHWGPALMGNIGDESRLEFAVVGDTVNVASRLEGLSRDLAADVVASETVVERAMKEGAGLTDFVARGPRVLRGRDSPVIVWTLTA